MSAAALKVTTEARQVDAAAQVGDGVFVTGLAALMGEGKGQPNTLCNG